MTTRIGAWAGTGAFITAGTTYSAVKGFASIHTFAREFLPQTDADIVP